MLDRFVEKEGLLWGGRLLLLFPLALVACGAPLAVQVAVWSAEGISFMATDKTLADHGISFIAQKDCALWRGLQGEDVCAEDPTAPVMVADAGDTADAAAAPGGPAVNLSSVTPAGGSGTEGVPAVEVDLRAIDELVARRPTLPDAVSGVVVDLGVMESATARRGPARTPPNAAAAGSVKLVPWGEWLKRVKARPAVARAPAPAEETTGLAVAHGKQPVTLQPGRSAGGKRARRTVGLGKAESGLYFVIGSFSHRNNATSLARRHGGLEAGVVAADIAGRRVYRVVVGPFPRERQEIIEGRIMNAGIVDAWSVRMSARDWSPSADALKPSADKRFSS